LELEDFPHLYASDLRALKRSDGHAYIGNKGIEEIVNALASIDPGLKLAGIERPNEQMKFAPLWTLNLPRRVFDFVIEKLPKVQTAGDFQKESLWVLIRKSTR